MVRARAPDGAAGTLAALEPRRWPERGRRHGRLGLGREVFARVDEPVLLEAVLLVVQLAIAPVLGEQLGMRAALDDLAAFHHQDLVRAADRGEAVGDHERPPAAPPRPEPVLDGGLALPIHAPGCFVEDEDAGGGEDRASGGVAPAGAWTDTCSRPSRPGTYSKLTSSNRTSPTTSPSGGRAPSAASSAVSRRISRIRSRPANASVICVPMDAMLMSGSATRPMKTPYMKKSPSVIVPARMACPPSRIMRMPIAPTMTVANAPTAEMPVIVVAMLRNSVCAPRVNTRRSPRSARYALTMRMPPSVSPSRPVTSALSFPRSRNSGRSLVKAYAMPPPKQARIRIAIRVSRQFK